PEGWLLVIGYWSLVFGFAPMDLGAPQIEDIFDALAVNQCPNELSNNRFDMRMNKVEKFGYYPPNC
ncbi:MAG: hypothetical protein KDI38_26020, partial [Calditrichaeota bacterium]|nr:hypothetical protein [Calditrichota bacterium]